MSPYSFYEREEIPNSCIQRVLDISKLEKDEQDVKNQEMDNFNGMKPSLILSIIGYVFVMMFFLEASMEFIIGLHPSNFWCVLLLFVCLILAILYTWFHFHRFRKKKKKYMDTGKGQQELQKAVKKERIRLKKLYGEYIDYPANLRFVDTDISLAEFEKLRDTRINCPFDTTDEDNILIKTGLAEYKIALIPVNGEIKGIYIPREFVPLCSQCGGKCPIGSLQIVNYVEHREYVWKEGGIFSEAEEVLETVSEPVYATKCNHHYDIASCAVSIGLLVNGYGRDMGISTRQRILSDNRLCKMDVAEEIKKFKELLDCNAITEEEYEEKKRKLLNLR